MSWSAISPSNIALIKYMGKMASASNQSSEKTLSEQTTAQKKASANSLQTDQLQKAPETTFSQYLHIPIDLGSHLSKSDEEILWFQNLALHPNMSYTLKHFVTKVQIEKSHYKDSWKPFKEDPFINKKLYHSSKPIHLDPSLSQSEQKKFLDFFQFLKRFFLIPGYYTISSQNNFPKAIGSASSASSFSALALAAYRLAKEKSSLTTDKFKSIKAQELAHLSRVGSGSSCRSLFAPWCLWEGYKIHSFECSWNHLLHQFIIVSDKDKKISSTIAHQRVKTSPLFTQRVNRANKRLLALKAALNLEDWRNCFQICYEEFLDIHSLFESSKPPFSYKTEETQKVLNCIVNFWKKYQDGPLITMDAGSNVHLLYRKDQKKDRDEISQQLSEFIILSSP